MKKIYIVSLCMLYLCCFWFGCKNHSQENENIDIIPIDISQKQEISFFDVFSEIDIIPLETKNDVLIQSVKKAIFHNDYYYILDDKQNKVFVFDLKGNYILQIANRGKGPGEYQGISDFEINQYTNNIEILDPRGSVFAFNNRGVFIEKYSLPEAIRAVHFFTNLNDDIVYFYSKSEMKSIFVYSKRKSKVIKTFFEVPENVTGPLQIQNSPFFKYDNYVLFYQGYTNDVYMVNENNFGLDIYYRWDFGDNNLKISNLPEIERGNIEDMKKYIEIVLEGNFVNSFFYNYENERVRLTRFRLNKTIYALLFNKYNSSYKIFNSFKEKVSPPFTISSYDKGVFSVIEPMDLDMYVNDKLLSVEQKEIFNKIDINSNPVIVKYKIEVENE